MQADAVTTKDYRRWSRAKHIHAHTIDTGFAGKVSPYVTFSKVSDNILPVYNAATNVTYKAVGDELWNKMNCKPHMLTFLEEPQTWCVERNRIDVFYNVYYVKNRVDESRYLKLEVAEIYAFDDKTKPRLNLYDAVNCIKSQDMRISSDEDENGYLNPRFPVMPEWGESLRHDANFVMKIFNDMWRTRQLQLHPADEEKYKNTPVTIGVCEWMKFKVSDDYRKAFTHTPGDKFDMLIKTKYVDSCKHVRVEHVSCQFYGQNNFVCSKCRMPNPLSRVSVREAGVIDEDVTLLPEKLLCTLCEKLYDESPQKAISRPENTIMQDLKQARVFLLGGNHERFRRQEMTELLENSERALEQTSVMVESAREDMKRTRLEMETDETLSKFFRNENLADREQMGKMRELMETVPQMVKTGAKYSMMSRSVAENVKWLRAGPFTFVRNNTTRSLVLSEEEDRPDDDDDQTDDDNFVEMAPPQ